MLRADLVQDCGRPLNPAIDLGQIEGAFVQGMGWLTSEELWWDARAGCAPSAPRPTRFPAAATCRRSSTSRLLENAPAARGDHLPLQGRRRAAAAARHRGMVGDQRCHRQPSPAIALPVNLDAPATPERILMAIVDLKKRMGGTIPSRLGMIENDASKCR